MSARKPSRRLLLFTPGLHEAGGVARRSRLFAEGLADRGWEVCVVTRSASDRRPRVFRRDGIRAIELPGFDNNTVGGLLYLVLAVPIGLWWGRSAQAAIAVQLSSPALAASVASGVWRRPFIAFSSTTGELSEVTAVQSSRLAPIRRRLLSRARYLVGQTDAAAAELLELVPRERVAVIPTPVRQVEPAGLNGEPRVVYTGRLSAEKDLIRLVAAWSTVLQTVPDATLTIVGTDSAYRPVGEELHAAVAAEPLLAQSVSFTGWVDDPGVHLRVADVFVLPSVSEGMSNSLLEAVSWGRIVVCSDIPGNVAVVGPDYPLTFPAGDTDLLADTLRRALTDDPVRTEATRRLEERAAAFDVDVIVASIERLLGLASDPQDRGERPCVSPTS